MHPSLLLYLGKRQRLVRLISNCPFIVNPALKRERGLCWRSEGCWLGCYFILRFESSVPRAYYGKISSLIRREGVMFDHGW